MADSGQRTGCDIAHDIAARFARGDPDRGETAHERRRVIDVDIMKLKVLARGDVRNTVGVFFREIR